MGTNAIYKYVYHFMPLQREGHKGRDMNNVKAAVLRSEYFFSNPLQFNDPFDCKPNFRTDSATGEPHHRRLCNQVETVLERAGIFCVAEELYNTLMWSHYTNGHKGVALQFATQHILAAFSQRGMVEKVRYQNNLPSLPSRLTNEAEQIRLVAFRKSRRWKYEKEVRLIIPDIDQRVQVLPEMPVRAVYFGCRSEPKDVDALLSSFKGKTKKIYKLHMSSTRFAYRRKPIAIKMNS